MNYTETLDYLYNKLPMFSRMGSDAFKKDLTNIRLLCEQLQNPQQHFKCIHTGGTNGKGSVSHMLAAVLQTAGYKTGLYTSPHLFDFRERIKVDGVMADEAFVVSFTEKIRGLIETIQPSFFEITVAMAFQYFKEKEVEVAVIEVGLGGRLDSTNIISPELSLITNIGWDHMNMLGNTLQEIAAEKAGIIKEGTPVVIGERQEEVAHIFEDRAKEKGAPIHFASDKFTPLQHQWKEGKLHLTLLDKIEKQQKVYTLQLPGIYQLANCCTVLQGIALLQEKGYQINEEQIAKALSHTVSITGLHGRWEVISNRPAVVLEVAHNKEGIQKMMAHLSYLSFDELHIVTGMVRDKDVDAVLSLLPKDASFYFTQAQIPRALPFPELAAKAKELGLRGNGYPHVNDALDAALANAGHSDLVIVCGSIFVVAEVDARFRKDGDPS